MIRKLLLQVGFILIWLGVLAPLPVQAQSLTVSFEVTKVTPVNVTVKAVVSGTTGTYPVKILLQDTSARVNSVKVNKLVTIPRKEAVIVGNQSADYFTIVALPDTQFYSQDYPDIYDSQTQWIADNRDAENIVMVVHLGDIVNNWDVVGEWANAKDSMDILRSAGVPYTVVPGNHDAYYADLKNGDANYNAYFPYTDFQNDSWHGGHFPENKYTSNYQLISFGGERYILLNLVGNMPFTYAATGWANTVLYKYSDYKAIVVTHAYIDTSGNKVKYEPSSVDPPHIWDNIVKMHPNIVAVWSGHNHGEYYNTDPRICMGIKNWG